MLIKEAARLVFVSLSLWGAAFAWGAATTGTGAPTALIPAAAGTLTLSPTLGTALPAGVPPRPAAAPKAGTDASARMIPGIKGGEEGKTPDATQIPSARLTMSEESTFQIFVREAIGQLLPLFGASFFDKAPSMYQPVQNIPATSDYAVGPGDELLIRVWGALDAELRAIVDRNGQISIPKVGTFSVVGIKAGELDGYIRSKIGRVFRNFEVNVTLGQLRSIQVYVVGHARAPGTYTLPSLSTLVNALFASGGASETGSMRHVQVKRNGQLVAEFDIYDFINKGDNRADIRLQAGDVIVIPPVGPRVALAGATARPAIYELARSQAPLEELIDISSGRLDVTTTTLRAGIERIDSMRTPSRTVAQLALDKKGLATPLKDGDIVTLYPISARIENMVVLERQGMPALRMPWQTGIKIKDFLQHDQLLADAYWKRVNQGGGISTPQKYEINWDYATVQRLNEQKLKTEILAFALDRAMAGDAKDNIELHPGDIVSLYDPNQKTPAAKDSVELSGSIVGDAKRFPWRQGLTVKDLIQDEPWLVDRYNYWQRFVGRDVKGQINWDYANITRRNEGGLSKGIIVFNLRHALAHAGSQNNHRLFPGDIVTLFSNTEMSVPQISQTRLVTVEGEVNAAGIYQLQPGETLRKLLLRAGGLTPQAYVFGAEFTREQTRIQQQERLDQAIRRLEQQTETQASTQLANLGGDDKATQAQAIQMQQQKISRLKTLKSNGRIALELPTHADGMADLPDLPLEDGDRIRIPPHSTYVMAVGAVNNDNALIWKPGRTVEEVLRLSGLTDAADKDNIFLLRADGTVLSKEQQGAWLFSLSSGFDAIDLMPGDAVVVPEKIDRRTAWNHFMVGLKDWTQILYQMGLGIAAWKTIR